MKLPLTGDRWRGDDPAVKLAVVQTVVLCTSTSHVARPKPLCLFPVYRARAVSEHRIFFFLVHTHRTDS